ncbi:hypothetical protein CMALT394_100034 [Carnobacterium maltaromaticum]|nr:hypothetical protein CMALT394_100034 [Carnobacterium maltaromaticum]
MVLSFIATGSTDNEKKISEKLVFLFLLMKGNQLFEKSDNIRFLSYLSAV